MEKNRRPDVIFNDRSEGLGAPKLLRFIGKKTTNRTDIQKLSFDQNILN